MVKQYIYPTIERGLEVRYRQSQVTRTVGRIHAGVVYFHDANNTATPVLGFWDRYEPIPKDGDLVRIARTTDPRHHKEFDCIGQVGTLVEQGGFHVSIGHGLIHWGPLSDFEVILPEAVTHYDSLSVSEVKVSEPETVSVPVELLKRFKAEVDDYESPASGTEAELIALLPKPKPKWVMVHEDWIAYDFAALPDAFDVIDTVIDGTSWMNMDQLKAAIREAFEKGQTNGKG